MSPDLESRIIKNGRTEYCGAERSDSQKVCNQLQSALASAVESQAGLQNLTRGERTSPPPADAISFSEAAKRLDIGASTLREWLRMKYLPEPKRHNRGFWFTENQVSLLKELKAFFQKYRMRPWKIKQDRLKEVLGFIWTNWN